ncbi:hypothetical protein [Flavobacterium aurantiibacter]|uniref:Uncharacterized protein n=1 Tax=Flavobacterium aurantiibacter TaxID=2023067 RepID=A0A256ABA1_9FLAO|nr:hypothetical protein [Flavobacterium aurantiibacter]OYQ50943.1 hypothetical protein CHX27_00535 [Flavobacterium aurantiibacter]
MDAKIWFTLVLLSLPLNNRISTFQKEDLKIISGNCVQYSKIPPNYNANELSKITGINQKYFTSAIELVTGGKKKVYPINDQVFNHSFFDSFDFNPNRNVLLYIRIYEHNKRSIVIVERIKMKT